MGVFKNSQGQWTVFSVALLAVAIMVFGFIPGLGLPGMLVIGFSDLVLQVVGWPFGYQNFFAFSKGDDYVWPAAIFATLLWPPSLVLAKIVVSRYASTLPRWKRAGIFFAILLLWGMAVTLWLYTQIPVNNSGLL